MTTTDGRADLQLVWSVLNLAQDVALPFEFDAGLRLIRTPEHLRSIHLETYNRKISKSPHDSVFRKKKLVACDPGQPKHYLPDDLEDQWNLFCVEIRDPIVWYSFRNLLLALPVPIWAPEGLSGARLHGNGTDGIHSGRSGSIFGFPNHSALDGYENPTLAKEHLDLAKSLWNEFRALCVDSSKAHLLERVTNVMSLHEASRYVSPLHPMRHMAEFSALEAALVHQPNGPVGHDSIGHQLRTKIELLSHRGDPYFPRVSDEPLAKVWSKLYKYRSAMAHGTTSQHPYVQSTKCVNCKDGEDLVGATVRAVIRLYLKEPQLLWDLQSV